MASAGRRVGLFATCLTDNFRPDIAFATAALLEQAGYEVCVPAQGCCGQPNYNGGDREGARQMAGHFIETFAGFDYVVAPSASCIAMIRQHYPLLFDESDSRYAQARELAGKAWEISSFLVDVAGFKDVDAIYKGKLVLHDACSGLRELGIREQPRVLLAQVRGLELVESENPESCCGFGGLFAAKYADISNRMADKKLTGLLNGSEDVAIATTEPGCLMHMDGKLHREGRPVRVFHVAEVLAGMTVKASC